MPFKVFLVILEMFLSMALVFVFLYIFTSIVSSNPEMKEMIQRAFGEIFESLKSRRRERRVKVPSKEVVKATLEVPVIRYFPRVKPSDSLVASAFISISVAYFVFVYGLSLPLQWLSRLFVYTVTAYLTLYGLVCLGEYFYVRYKEQENYAFDVLKSAVSLMLVPWLILANIFTEQLQVLTVDVEAVEKEGASSIFRHIKAIPIPSEYIPLAKMLTILVLVVIIIDIAIMVIRYVRITPRTEYLPALY